MGNREKCEGEIGTVNRLHTLQQHLPPGTYFHTFHTYRLLLFVQPSTHTAPLSAPHILSALTHCAPSRIERLHRRPFGAHIPRPPCPPPPSGSPPTRFPSSLPAPPCPPLQAIERKDDFLSTMSHELRTPLNGIIGLSESLMAGSAGQLPDKV